LSDGIITRQEIAPAGRILDADHRRSHHLMDRQQFNGIPYPQCRRRRRRADPGEYAVFGMIPLVTVDFQDILT
jgi:hypothetical protein